MNLNERLKKLIDHDVIVNMLCDPRDPDGTPDSLPPGRLREVGDDYFVLQTASEEEGGFANEGGEWVVSIQYVTSIIHMVPECSGCAAELVNRPKPRT
ncbi:MAG: hypothetical protein HY680_10880 [Chloroflexi bacterium]|nr:hypothetical protein [Chloroflexota bacterium]